MAAHNNIWEIAEAHLNGTLPPAEAAKLEQRLAADTEYANEYYEVAGLIRSMEGNGRQKRFRNMLADIHQQQSVPVKKVKLINLPAHFWRTAAVAAGVALLTSSITVLSLRPSAKKSESQYSLISREVERLKKVQASQQATQNQLIENINKNSKPVPQANDVKYTGTGFALNNDGYFVTAYHVLNDGNGEGDSVYIETRDGEYYKASLYSFNAKADIAIMKVDKKNFHFVKGDVPYTFANAKSGLGARIFTLGYPKESVVYAEGYISGRNGFEGDVLQYTLDLPAGHGQSGSPLVDAKGNVLGILTAIGSSQEENTYAVSSKALLDMVHGLPKDAIRLPKANKLAKLNREKQIEKLEACTFSVKVFKK